jgi:hypothetical protein
VVPRYVPVLPVRQGEMLGLQDLDDDVRSRTTPLFVVTPLKRGQQAQMLVDAVAGIARSGATPAYVDVRAPGDGSAVHPVARLFELARLRRLPLIPVTTPRASRAQREAVQAVAAQDGRGLCLRASRADWPRLASGDALDGLGVTPAEVDLVLHLTGALPAVDLVPRLDDWRSLVVAGTSFPRPSEILGNGLTEWPRWEWTAYEQLWASAPTGSRRPDFGDYGVLHPDAFAAPHGTTVRVVLRYSTPDKWLVGRGGLYSTPAGRSLGAAAVRPVADQLWHHPQFERAHHCAMERWVVEVAWTGTRGGGPMTWHRHATHHHVVRVTDQLRYLGVPSAPQDLRDPR